MGEWLPIDTYDKKLWDGEIAILADDDGNEAVGSYGFEDEIWDGEDEYLIGAWHKADGDTRGIYPLGFEPTKWKRTTLPEGE